MKKVLAILALMVLVAPVMVSAAAPAYEDSCTLRHDMSDDTWSNMGIICPPSGACNFDGTTMVDGVSATCGTCCLMNTIYTITDWIFVIIVVIAVIMILLGAFNIITAGGSPDKVTSGRNYILWAAVGVIVAAVAKVIPMVARNIVGM